MKIKYFQVILVGLMTIPFLSLLFIAVPASYAQSSQIWSDPINLSNAGSSSNPQMVIDREGTIHIVWVDLFDGYKYVKSIDGVEWSSPITVNFPFSPAVDSRNSQTLNVSSQPEFLADNNGAMHVFWLDETNTLFYSKDSSGDDLSSGWSSPRKLADSVVKFETVISSQSILHVGYVTSLSEDERPAGIYYLQLGKSNSPSDINLYSSQYFRSSLPEDSNLHITVYETNEVETVYMVWDDRPLKQIFLSKSLDGGSVWESAVPITDLDGNTSVSYNINVGAFDGEVVILWQYGLEGQCIQYSQRSTDSVEKFSPPVKMLDETTRCPISSDFLLLNEDFSVVFLNIMEEISLIAWNGTDWSKPLTQNEIITFINPANFDTVIFGCQKVSAHKGKIFVVGCDKGSGGDIWFSSRPFGTVKDWFSTASVWSAPVELPFVNQEISALSSVLDGNDKFRSIWVQLPLGVDEEDMTIQYTEWNGENWTSPVPIISELDGDPAYLKFKSDNQKRLLLTWVDSVSGDIWFSWAGTERAYLSSEWENPKYVPSISQANSSPDILVDGSGKILIAYAIPINEQRGIYFVESEDGGITWSQPLHIFDAASNGWDIVDQPNINLTGDGRLHVLFRRYSLQGEPRRSLGLYYSQSANGGSTWSDPEQVSENPEPWSEIVSYDRSTLHRLWQEYRQSLLVSFHQVSQDGGITWKNPVIVSSNNATSGPVSLTMDKAGNLHFLQLTSRNDLFSLSHQMWNGSSWSTQKPGDPYLADGGIPSSIAAGVSSGGNLHISILVDYPDNVNDEKKNAMLHMEKSLELPAEIITPRPAMIATAEPEAGMTEDVSEVAQEPIENSPETGTSRLSLSLSKNEVGLLLLGGLLALLSALFLPVYRRRAKSKKLQ